MAITKPATIRRYRKLSRELMRGWRVKLRKAERVQSTLWLTRRTMEQVHQRARQLGVFRRSVLLAALEHGLRSVSNSDIVRNQMEWSELAKIPRAPLWPGAPHGDNPRDFLKRWRRQHPLMKEKAS